MAFDPIPLCAKAPKILQLPLLNVLLSIGIPFNRWLGIGVESLQPDKVVAYLKDRKLRQNHLKSAHACALALLGEFPAGLLIAQNFSFSKYRIILSELSCSYQKQGRGKLHSVAYRPPFWPPADESGEIWISLETQVQNTAKEDVALVKTRWQIKSWDLVRSTKV